MCLPLALVYASPEFSQQQMAWRDNSEGADLIFSAAESSGLVLYLRALHGELIEVSYKESLCLE
jgi:hypothetical protein